MFRGKLINASCYVFFKSWNIREIFPPMSKLDNIASIDIAVYDVGNI